MLFADDAAVVSHTESGLQNLIDCFSQACDDFGLTISVKKTEVMGQNVSIPPVIKIDNKALEVTDHFTYLGSTISSNLSLDHELDRRIAKAAGVMSKLSNRVWNNNRLTLKTKIRVYQACIISTLLYGSEAWTSYARQENRLECFHMRCLRRILGITWEDKVTNNSVLKQTNMLSIHSLLCQRRLRWLGHVRRMPDGRIPKDILYGELASGKRSVGRPSLRFKDVCKRDLRAADIDISQWEAHAADRDNWRLTVKHGTKRNEERRRTQMEEKRARRKERQQHPQADSIFVCSKCQKDCHARIGLTTHYRHCKEKSR